jgi:predicted tellurium resistance membrane protein TerC
VVSFDPTVSPAGEAGADRVIVEAIIAIVALTAMEIVLGIDNIVFITILTSQLPESQQSKGRRVGLSLALVSRLLLLAALSLVLQLDEPIFQFTSLGMFTDFFELHEHINRVTVKDLILLAGGLFLIAKSVREIHEKMEGEQKIGLRFSGFAATMVQVVAIDVVFSLDSIITAVGMVKPEMIWAMAVAIVISVIIMLVFSEIVSRFVTRHPTVKMLALSFLLLIGVMLVAEAIGTKIDKGYIYFAMAFALLVEVLNLRAKARAPSTGAAGG